MLFATAVGDSLLKSPTFGCGGGVNLFGAAASIFGIIGVGNLISATFGGGGSGFGISILGCSSLATGGGGMILTLGTCGTYGLGLLNRQFQLRLFVAVFLHLVDCATVTEQ